MQRSAISLSKQEESSMIKLKMSALVLGLFLSSGAAQAAPSYCASGLLGDDPTVNNDTPVLSVNDMRYNGKVAADCYGFVRADNDTAANINSLNWGTGWQFAARYNIGGADVSNLVLGIRWSVVASPGQSGTWFLSGIDQNGGLPANLGDTFDFVGVLKGGNGWAAYKFDRMVFDGSDGGTYAIGFQNNGNQAPDLSHFSLYARNGSGNGGGGNLNNVPEPAPLALAGIGLVALALTSRRAKQT